MSDKLSCYGAWISLYTCLDGQMSYAACTLWKPFADDFRESVWRELELY